MLCCAFPWSDENLTYNEQSSSTSNYPGQRRPYTTNLSGGPTSFSPSPEKAPDHANMNLISVTVPVGVVAGQTIHVAHPDGSGRLIAAQVPPGSQVGTIFYVQPPAGFSPIPPATSMQPVPANSHPEPSAPIAEPVSTDYSGVSAIPPPVPFSQCLESPTTHSQNLGMRSICPLAPPTVQSSKKIVKAVVPPGVAPGTTIHIQVPGENRVIAAQVPPNCTEFHVEYQPQASGPSLAVPVSPTVPPPVAPPQQKLVLVNVPPGSVPGSTIYVQIPGEPGRMLSAQIPAGNVSAFHVSYVPRSQS